MENKNYESIYVTGSDMTIIMNWPDDSAYDNCKSEDFPCPTLINFYFGDPDERYTEDYIKDFIDRQSKIKSTISLLEQLKGLQPDNKEIDDSIECLKSLVVKLY